MTRIFAIITGVLMFATGMTISIDRHYCGGELAGTKISFSGKLASCGMENIKHTCPNLPSINEQCCDDQLTFFTISSKFITKYTNLSFTVSSRSLLPVIGSNVVSGSTYLAAYDKWEFPPGENLKPAPLLSEICVYRI